MCSSDLAKSRATTIVRLAITQGWAKKTLHLLLWKRDSLHEELLISILTRDSTTSAPIRASPIFYAGSDCHNYHFRHPILKLAKTACSSCKSVAQHLSVYR